MFVKEDYTKRRCTLYTNTHQIHDEGVPRLDLCGGEVQNLPNRPPVYLEQSQNQKSDSSPRANGGKNIQI